uniref:Uncharacterized protein n=1 Tax=Knipowitschia caucasica TaxID=637954 RepID=A0AAV2M7C0_KNICA
MFQQVAVTSLPKFLRQREESTPQFTRTCRLDVGKAQSVLHVLGTTLKTCLNRSAPPTTKYFSVKCTHNVQYLISPRPEETSHLSPVPLTDNSVLLISMKEASDHENDNKLSVRYYDTDKNVLDKAVLHFTAVEICLDVDADRDGVVEKNNPDKDSWKWGPRGHGAILLVNCDSESVNRKRPDSERDHVILSSDVKDMSPMMLRTKGPAKLPDLSTQKYTPNHPTPIPHNLPLYLQPSFLPISTPFPNPYILPFTLKPHLLPHLHLPIPKTTNTLSPLPHHPKTQLQTPPL